MKHFKQFLLAVLVALSSSVTASAYDFEADGIYYNILSDNSVEVTYQRTGSYGDYNEVTTYSGAITIPSSVIYNTGTYVVTSIGNHAFDYSSKLTAVEIPETVTSIGIRAFYNCTGLKSIEIPNSVTSIEREAFYYCYSMTSVKLPSQITTIKLNTFFGCERLSSVEIPNSVTTIEAGAFQNCKLSSVSLPQPLTTIGSRAFSECYLTTLNIPNSVTSIGDCAFQGCLMQSVTIPSSVTSIGTNPFAAASNLRFISVYGNNFSERNNCLISKDGVLISSATNSKSTITIPNSVKSIGPYAFYKSLSIWYVNIPETVTEIGMDAFYGCINLKSIEIPKSVTSIGSFAFQGCYGLKEITSMNTIPPFIREDGGVFGGVSKSECVLKFPVEASGAYMKAEGWRDFSNISAIVPDIIELNDIENYNVGLEVEECNIAYTRNFNSTNWQPLYIPFNMSYAEWSEKADVAEIRGIYSYDDNEGVEHTVLAFHRLTSGELKANTSYVIKPKEAGKVTFSCFNKTLKATESGSVWCASTRKKYTLTGIYEEKVDMDGVYAMSGGAFYLGDSSSPALSPFRFYLTVEDMDNGYGTGKSLTKAPARIQMFVDGETTDINEAVAGNEMDGGYYDLSGRRVMQPAKGFYVRNGKKVFIK